MSERSINHWVPCSAGLCESLCEGKDPQRPSRKQGSLVVPRTPPLWALHDWHQNGLEPGLPSEASRRWAKWEQWQSEGHTPPDLTGTASLSSRQLLPSTTWTRYCKNYWFFFQKNLRLWIFISNCLFFSINSSIDSNPSSIQNRQQL